MLQVDFVLSKVEYNVCCFLYVFVHSYIYHFHTDFILLYCCFMTILE